MIFLIFAGFIALIAGVMFIFFPKQLARVDRAANKVVKNIDAMSLKHRMGLGLFLIFVAACLWGIAYYLFK